MLGSPMDYKYDVALSFAGEDRPYVQGVADVPRASAVRVFHDEYEVDTVCGKDLYVHLDDLYRNNTSLNSGHPVDRLVVVGPFTSDDKCPPGEYGPTILRGRRVLDFSGAFGLGIGCADLSPNC